VTMMRRNGESIGLSGVAGVLPRYQQDLNELNAAGLLSSSPEALEALGFQRAHVCEPGARLEQMALEAAQLALNDAGLRPPDVDFLIWASARPENQLRHSQTSSGPKSRCNPMDGFRYSSAWLQDALDLQNADVMAVAQQGCSTMFSALRIARSLLLSEPQRQHALCVGVDMLPRGAQREILYNVISDAACAVVVSRGCHNDVWLGYSQISRGYYWDPSKSEPQILAAYFPTATVLLRQLLAEHSLRPDEVDVVVPTGVSRASWDILLRLVGIPENRLFTDVASFGHTMTSDTFIHLQELRRRGVVPRGSRLLLFTFGFGCSWCGLLLEH
jgi:3-oxoacyl-[acyl-carrier-protein] synthase III